MLSLRAGGRRDQALGKTCAMFLDAEKATIVANVSASRRGAEALLKVKFAPRQTSSRARGRKDYERWQLLGR